ncbi:PREDICTED: breast cancer type 1 susceptibility protein isoform X2 [Gavialis gangeticus]|uniref:breast cancer type 1 susceptibility protein isoform X2 n=1 Tax=Gavialis gangeticus TaxID=94835 RepID=UPI00092FBA7F|nr:PREDICTED: breast cancer type 1 susceptibility protein isoform X2 [Gavialis gangeticus]
MDFSVVALGDVQNVLSAMQKNLECPICLEVMKEPVSTKCDHIFCRFCMFKLLSKKKNSLVQCPMCKTEVTKRSLQENPRFKQLIEGLLKTIHAFELDAGVKFLNHQDFSKKPIETSSADTLRKESCVIQSKGYRNRQKKVKENGQANLTLGTITGVQLSGDMVKWSSPRNKKRKLDSDKIMYIEFGSDSSEDLFKKAGGSRAQDKEMFQTPPEKLEELKYAENESESPHNVQVTNLGGREILLSDFRGECDFSEEGLGSSEDIQNISEDFQAAQVNLSEERLKNNLSISASNLHAEPCDRTANVTSSQKKGSNSGKEMSAVGAQCISKSEEPGSQHSPKSQSDKNEEASSAAQYVKTSETFEQKCDSLHEEMSSVEQQLQPEAVPTDTLSQVSKKRLKKSIQKVNDWFSKSSEVLSCSPQDDGAADIEEGGSCLSDRDSFISEKTDIMVNCLEVAMECENEKSLSKPSVHSIENKIFGKTYQRGRKSNRHVNLGVVPQNTEVEEVPSDVQHLDNSRTDRLKRKRKTLCGLQPGDFIKKRDAKVVDEPDCLVAARGKAGEDSSVVGGDPVCEKKGENTSAELPLKKGEFIFKNDVQKVIGDCTDGEPELKVCDQRNAKKGRSSLTERNRHSARTKHTLQLVVNRNSSSPHQTELQIDSYPSSEESKKIDSEQRQVRRSRRLQLLTGEMTKETRRRDEPNETSRKQANKNESFSSGFQRAVLVNAPECKDQVEQQDILNHSVPLSDCNLKGTSLEASKVHASPETSFTIMGIEKDFSDPSLLQLQEANACSLLASADTQGSHSLLQPCSTNVEETAGPVLNSPETKQCTAPEPDKSKLHACSPKDNGCYTGYDPESFKNQKMTEAKSILELNTETEDSELDVQYLRNMFRHTKRLSFTFHSGLVKESAIENTASEAEGKMSTTQIEYRYNSRDLKNDPLHLKKPSVGLTGVSERESKTCQTAKDVSGNDTECRHIREHGANASQVQSQEQFLSSARLFGAKIKHKSRLQKRKQSAEKTVSSEIVRESELNLDLNQYNGSLSDRNNTEEPIFQGTGLSIINGTGSSSESNQAEKNEVAENKQPVLNVQPESMLNCLAVCQQSPAEFSCKISEKKCSEGKGKQVKSDKEQINQVANMWVPDCLISEEALEQPIEDTSGFPALSEMPDDLVFSAEDLKGNNSFCDADRKNISAVFVKTDENALVRDINSDSSSSKSRSQTFVRRSRRAVQKLQSSEEESNEDEDLPCFQELIFGKSSSTHTQSQKQKTSVRRSSNPSAQILALQSSSSGSDKVVQKMPEATLKEVCVSPSQESECSVNLFSSQSNMSEDSANRPEDLRLVLSTKEKKNFSEGKEASPHENEELKGRKNPLQDEHQGDPNLESNIGEPSAYDSEASHLGDSYGLSTQSEILTTQQKNDMQNNLKKLQQEMAVLEAVLEQHGSQDSELPCSSVEGATATGLMRTARGAMLTSEADLDNHKTGSSVGLPPDEFHGMPSHCFNSNSKGLEEEGSSASLLSTSKSHLLNKEAWQHSFPKTLALEPNTPSQEGKSQQGDAALLLVQEAEEQCNQYRKEPENTTEQKSGTKLNSAAILTSPCGNMSRIPNSSPLKFLKRPSHSQTAEATNGSAIPSNIDDRKNTQRCELEKRAFASTHVPHHRAGKENAKSPVVLSRKKMSIVASGLNQHELLLVQKFAWKTQSTLSNQITEGTTHVIMKTDMDLVCERTLKYFLGIAGRKWVVSYQWVIQSFKEGRILYESDFEVRGDVINGRNHQGPKRARQSQAGKLFKDFEICCYGPFTDMNTENLEWMVELCGASVVTQLHLFTHKAKHAAVVVVQPDAWMEDAGYRAIQQKCSATVVTREWVLDSVACYERQEFDAYLVSQE